MTAQKLDVRTDALSEGLSEPDSYLLQPSAYFSRSWHDAEQATIFSHTWHLVGHSSELTGDRRLSVVTGAGRYLLGSRPDGSLWGRRSSCPASDRYPEAEPGEMDRPAVAVWEDLVWLNPDPDATPLDSWLAGVLDMVNGYRPSALALGGRSKIPAAFNWKLFVENHIDVLHLWYLHANTLPGAHRLFEWDFVGPHWVSYEPLLPNTERPRRFSEPLSHVAGGRGPEGIGAHLLFPNVVFTTGRDSVQLTTMRPTGPESCELDTIVLCEPGARPIDEHEALRHRVPGGVLDQDLTACEGMQAVIRSSRFSVGPIARDHERPITRFQTELLRAMGDTVRTSSDVDSNPPGNRIS